MEEKNKAINRTDHIQTEDVKTGRLWRTKTVALGASLAFVTLVVHDATIRLMVGRELKLDHKTCSWTRRKSNPLLTFAFALAKSPVVEPGYHPLALDTVVG